MQTPVDQIRSSTSEMTNGLVESLVREVRLFDGTPDRPIPYELRLMIEMRIKAHLGLLLGVCEPSHVSESMRPMLEAARHMDNRSL